MEETKEQQGLYRFFQFAIYLSIFLEFYLFLYVEKSLEYGILNKTNLLFATKLARIPFYSGLVASKLFTIFLVILVSIGTLSKKKKDLNPKNHICPK